MNGAGTEYIAMLNGVVSQWDPDGDFLSYVTLQGYGSLSGESANSLPARGIAAFGNFWLTYNGAGIVSLWDTFGNRRANITLTGAGTSSTSDYSFCYCNGKVFIADSSGVTWRGYDVGSPGKVAIYGAPSTASWNTDVQSKILGTGLFVQVDANLAGSEAGHSRVKIKKIDDAEKYQRIKKGMEKFKLDGLIISGGDDSGSVLIDLNEHGI